MTNTQAITSTIFVILMAAAFLGKQIDIFFAR